MKQNYGCEKDLKMHLTEAHTALESYFHAYRQQIIGNDLYFDAPEGRKKVIYADWTASGRLYRPIEEKMIEDFGPYVANTHTETSLTGSSMTMAYHTARQIIKAHVNAAASDCIIISGSGMTGAVNKLQRILGLKIYEQHRPFVQLAEADRPIVFVTHMEHHSNQTSWLETIAEVECIGANGEGCVDLEHLQFLLEKYASRKNKIAAVTACSNVTGIQTPYHQIAALMHQHGGLCFVDFACSAPYVHIDMHPENEAQQLDAIYFSPHKFLGGPGTPGILIFNSSLYHNRVPDHPGGGTVKWTNPWQGRSYIENIEDREDGGTPPFLQTIKTALCIKLKEAMGVENILQREEEMLEIIFDKLEGISNLHILAPQMKKRLGVISFYIEGLHYNLGVKLLNDKYGIQVRGGCSCAGTYGHYLLNVSPQTSESITSDIDKGNLASKPGWIRMSVHPTMTNEEVLFICEAIEALAQNFQAWALDYNYDAHSNEFVHKHHICKATSNIQSWFDTPSPAHL